MIGIMKYKDIDYEITKLLYERVTVRDANGGRRIQLSYTECAEKLSVRLNRSVNRRKLGEPLEVASIICHELGLPLISAIVTHHNPKTTQEVGEGFYPMACRFKPEYKSMNPADAWKTELHIVIDWKDWSKLDNYLKEHYR